MWADQLRETDDLIYQTIKDCRKVSIHPDVLALATQLVAQGDDKVRKAAPFAVWPDHGTWIEGLWDTEDGPLHFGVYFYGDQNDRSGLRSVEEGVGHLLVSTQGAANPNVIPVRYDLTNYELEVADLRRYLEHRVGKAPSDHPSLPKMRQYLAATSPTDQIAFAAQTAEVRNVFKPILVAILALMNSPKLIRVKEHDMEKFNKRRMKRGKYPYFPHHEITLNIDKSVFEVQRGQDDGPERCLHFVRAHPRFFIHPRYKAQVTIVQPHWRGNPELGIKDPHYNVGRENSQWPDKNTE